MKSEGFILPKGAVSLAQVQKIEFSVLSPEEIVSWSVMEVTENKIYQGINPKRGGPNDARMGIAKPGQKCETCGQSKQCQGHFGHIKLAEPVFHLGYIKYIEKILKCICHHCSKLKCVTNQLQKQKLAEILKIKSPEKKLKQLVHLLGAINRCPLVDDQDEKLGCGSFIPTKITIKEKMKIIVLQKQEKSHQQVQYGAKRVQIILDKISPSDRCIIGFADTKPSNLLLNVLPVLPPQVRPSVELGPQKRAEDDITNAYSRIVGLNNQVKQGRNNLQRSEFVRQIQKLVASYMVKLDKRYLPNLKDKHYGKKNATKKIKSLEERLVAKEGRFRQHLMGKRVDFSARSVISPDPYIALDQLGVPEKIAKSLTFPEQINEFNYDKILDLCLNGKVKFLIQPQIGKRNTNFIYLNKFKKQQIQQFVTIGTIAERELSDGDYVLFNRQPTLHRMSMMGHKVKILPYNTFRLNLSVCSPYNADFDGDEMNMHVPQSVEAQAQLQFIASVPNQIMNPKNSTPIMGIVQDSLLGVYLLTMRDMFLTRKQIMNLLMWIDPMTKFEFGDLPMPCIWKPQPLWTGKQLVSMIIPEKISLSMNAEGIPKKNITDTQSLVIKNGELLSGVLQRDHVGPGCGKLIQAIWVQRGPQVTSDFITNVQRVVTNWLMNNGFSVGFADVTPTPELDYERNYQIQQIRQNYYRNIHIFRNLPKYQHQNFHQKGKKVAQSLEFKINLDLNNALSLMQKTVSQKISPQTNNIYKMINAKSKGSLTNLTQIMFCLGNQNVDGQRCPQGFRRRALPHFSKDDNSPQPRGFVFSSFYKGLKPHQFFFHSMAGRQGLSDTAVKTSSIGYIQRKLVKALQDLTVRYDGTVRDSKDNILERFYGEDGFQPQFIERHELNDCLLDQITFEEIYKWGDKKLSTCSKEARKLLKEEYHYLWESRNTLRKRVLTSGDSSVQYNCPINIDRIIKEQLQNIDAEGKIVDPVIAVQMVEQLANTCILPRFRKIFLTEISSLNLSSRDGTISSQTYVKRKIQLLKEYGCQIFQIHLKFWLSTTKIVKKHKLTQSQLQRIIQTIKHKYVRVLAPAGEAIGSLAAQSIGEPTTQMTLNTFHLAGVSDKNVTLGIPRLRELLDVSKNIKTPYMTVYYKRKLIWQERQSDQSNQIQNTLLAIMPERHMRDYIINTSIYFDAGGNQKSNIDDREITITNTTPWVLSLKFDYQKVTNVTIWKLILNALRDNLGKQFDIIQLASIGEGAQPEIHLRLNPETLSKIQSRKAFKHLNLRESQLKDIFLSGIKGIKSIKTGKRINHICKDSDQIYLNQAKSEDLSQKEFQLIFEAIGSNLKGVLSCGYVDSTRTTSNNLNQVYSTLGIEAARQVFIYEFKEILKPYNITINERHLSVLSDWMTCRGNLVPINRHGINRVRDVSVLRKATFEQTADVLYNAAVFSEIDELKGVSEKIIFGQKLNLGTNVCKIYLDQRKLGNYAYQPKLRIRINQQNAQNNRQELQYDPTSHLPIMGTPQPLQQSLLNIESPKSQPYTRSPMNSPAFSSSLMSPMYARSPEQQGHSLSPTRDKNLHSPSYSHDEQQRFQDRPQNQTTSSAQFSPVYAKRGRNEYLRSSNSPSYEKNVTYESSMSPNYNQGEHFKDINSSRPVRPSQFSRKLKRESSDSDSSDNK